MTPEEKQERLAQIAERASTTTKGPWQVRYMETMHRLDSPICKETCGKGSLPIRLEHSSEEEAARYRGVTEMHVNQHLDLVVDIIADDDSHVFCTGHDYDEAGVVAPNDAEFIAHARADIDFLLSLVKSQEEDYALVDKYLAELKQELGLPPNAHASISLDRYKERVATSMRSACVEKVKAVAREMLQEFAAEYKPDGTSFSVMKREVVFAMQRRLLPELESLSIEKDSTTRAP